MTRYGRAFRSGGRGPPSETARTEPPSHSSVPDRALLEATPHALLALNLSIDLFSGASELRLSDGCQKPFDPAHHGCEQLPRQMTLRQEQPIIAGMFHQTTARLLQPVVIAEAAIGLEQAAQSAGVSLRMI